MLEPVSNRNPLRPPKRPTFFGLLIITVVVLIAFLIGAWLLVRETGHSLLPSRHEDNHPHAMLRQPGGRSIA